MAHGSHLGGSSGIPPDLLQQIIDAGLADDRMGMAGQKARTGASLFGTPGAQGMNVGGTYRAASPLEHLSTAMSRILGGKMQRDAHGEMEGLLGQKAAGRRAMGQAQAGLFAPPTAEAMNAPEPPAFSPPDFAAPGLGFGVDSINETPARALARAMDERSRLGGMAALSGDPAIAASGQGLLADARTLGAQQFEGQQNKAKLALDTRKMDADEAARAAEAAYRTATLTETTRSHRASEALARGAQEQDAWQTVPDPMGGGFLQWNRKTGEFRTIAPGSKPPGAGQPAGPLPGLPGKPTEDQRKKVLGASESISQLDMAIGALEKAPGAYGGVGNFVAGLAESAGGTPVQSLTARRYSPDELRVKNYVSNVVSKIINERAGANVTLREELRQKFLPQDTDGLGQAKQKLGDLRAMMASTYEAQGSGLVPSPNAGADAPPAPGAVKTKSGRWAVQNAQGQLEYVEGQ
jgi:hypothetical protein